ncbi:hypothetical protein BDB00DRAFT_863467 [Zychaea mexicana]|uniref:uncharacterized protein n=1 Tax=Zychaea mexicana TaxID=64656 RepID=UPI0022FEF7FD|nr:uncharacterized protein BDB00DRAFT_863467 [Zychaea mexicana]KAI9468682.1 hypothetical protein BDB00DRAFT_863467 [Zychaea mexicana]
MNNLIERQRGLHEEIERLEQAIVDQFMQDPKTHRERLRNEHVVDKFLTRIADKSENLYDMYEDKNGLRQSEVEALSASTEFSEFYERLRVIKDHHRKYPNEPVEPPEMEFIHMNLNNGAGGEEGEEDELEKKFSGEESYGRYLDMNELHNEYVNLKDVKKLDYLQYLSEFDDFAQAYPRNIKTSPEYKQYLDHLKTYLYSFFRRAKPLFDLVEMEKQVDKDLEEKWEKGQIPGWEEIGNDMVDSDVYCEACQKQFTKKTVYDSHLTGKKHRKNAEKLQGEQQEQTNGEYNGSAKQDRRRGLARNELLIAKYAEGLSDIREETKSNVERKQALTDKERTLEQDQEEIDLAEQESDDEDEDRIYNPLKLPLGWDGKPIPYWLYKLHGLGVEYPCEICGNYVYMGRKAFDKHFQEWRHAHGMRCLGIPNTRHFHEITKIDDAFALYAKLKKENAAADFVADSMEEYEDDEGNVYNRKTYEDLRRQGII